MSITERVHESIVFDRRIRVLARHLANVIPEHVSVLDVGCGDGLLARSISQMRPDLAFQGIEVLLRPETHIEVTEFDGSTVPFSEKSFDVVMMVDVLHHTDDPCVLLREASRVAASAVVLKDHTLTGWMSEPTLRFMDRVGNARHGVALPYNYWRPDQWSDAFEQLGLEIEEWKERLGLYWWPASLLFDRRLHFVAKLVNNGHESDSAGEQLDSDRQTGPVVLPEADDPYGIVCPGSPAPVTQPIGA